MNEQNQENPEPQDSDVDLTEDTQVPVDDDFGPTPEPIMNDPLPQSPLVDGGPGDHDEEDVPAALERDTADGSGFDDEHELPAEDFERYADENAETEEQ